MTQAATTLDTLRAPATSPSVEAGFYNSDSYGLLRKISVDFAASDIVPRRFRGKAPNCMIALNMAMRMKSDPLMVMQNLYDVHGTPSWSASFLIACFNQCGRFSPIAYKFEGATGTDAWGCRAVSSYLVDGTPIEGPLVTIGIAKAEGWYGRDGSKWKTIPEQMLRYRSAAWMIRSTAPEIGLGFQTREEVTDTYEMERGNDGAYSVRVEDMKSVAMAVESATGNVSTGAPTEPAKPNARAEMDALREETRKLWESAGGTLEEAEQSTGLYMKQWTRQHCTKLQEAARRRMSDVIPTPSANPTPEAVPAEPAAEVFEDTFEGGGAELVTCPSNEKQVDASECTKKSCRNGCPAFE